MSKICYLCDRSAKDRKYSMHSFPKNETVHMAWLYVCNLSVTDNVRNVHICSAHFRDNNFRDTRGINRTSCLLKRGSVPCIDVPNESINAEGKRSPINISEVEPPVSNVVVVSNSDQTEGMLYTPKKRKFAEPRYISKICTPDVSTPKRARRVIAFVKETDKAKSKKIATLEKDNRKLKKRISSLKELITHLTDEKMLSAEAGETFMELMPSSMHEMLSRKMQKKEHYETELRSFALTLHFYSPKAYNYVRKTWKNLHPRNWYRVVDGTPGFTKEALDAIKIRTEERENAWKPPIIVNVVSDEMVIRKEMVFDKEEKKMNILNNNY